jgi:RNA polymerase sigma-70 factor (ECF subfamily)
MRQGGEPLVGRPANEAIPQLVDRLGGKMLALGLKFCGNRADAEDLVQETFLQAYRSWEQFEGRSDPSSWLYMIAARGCQRMHRRRAGAPTRLESLDEQLPSGLALVANLPSPEDGPLDNKLQREAIEIVDGALAKLPADFRLPLVLKEIAELSLREIATILGIKEATVKTRVHRARLALRAALAESIGEPRAARPDHSRQICLDLLRAKMDALDRAAPFPVAREDLCSRCRAFVDSLDLTVELCRWVDEGELPEALRKKLEEQFQR